MRLFKSAMDTICRLCLTVSDNMAGNLSEETKIMDKLSCLNVQILVNELLPSLVCYYCSKTLEDILTYRENVIQNQYRLLEKFNRGSIDDFYRSVKYKENTIKTEICETDPDAEDSTDRSVCYESKLSTNSNIKYQEDNSLKLGGENDETVCYESVTKITNTLMTKTTQKEKKHSKFKKDNKTHKTNVSSKTKASKTKITNQSSETEDKPKRCNLKATDNSFETKYDKEVFTKVENISEDKQTKHTHNDTEVTNEIDTKINDKKCLTCFKYLSSNAELIRHYKTIHSNVDKENETDLVQNNLKIDENKGINDEAKISTSQKLGRPYNCKICGRTFTSVYAIIRHARAHSDYSLSCSHRCGYTTVYRGALVDHERRHEKDFKYKCETCGAGFHVKTWHDQHQNIHSNVKPFVCEVCGMTFHMNRYLTSHRSTVHGESMKGVKRFVCPHCDLIFYGTRSFRTHLEQHIGKKKFLCARCGKECSSGEQLKHHNNSHLGLKPFACSICNKRFAKKFNLSVHQRAHAGEKQLCQECGKHFAQRSTLLRHVRKCHPEIKEFKNKSESIINK